MSYYVIIPETVLCDDRLSSSEKLMYGEILALSRKHGFCFASNQYFSDKYNVSKVTVSNWVQELIEYGYVKADYSKDETNKTYRKIYVLDNNSIGEDEEVPEVNSYTSQKATNKDVEEIIKYLNEVCGSRFRTNTNATNKIIKSRLKEGFSLQDFKSVIEWKYHQWGEKPFKFSSGQLSSDYLRPSTLFGNNFESYLYEANNNKDSEARVVRSVPVDSDRSGITFV